MFSAGGRFITNRFSVDIVAGSDCSGFNASLTGHRQVLMYWAGRLSVLRLMFGSIVRRLNLPSRFTNCFETREKTIFFSVGLQPCILDLLFFTHLRVLTRTFLD